MNSADFPLLLIETTFCSTGALLLVLLLRRVTRRYFGARIAYALWWTVPAALVAVLLPASESPVVAPVLTFVRASVQPVLAVPVATAPDYGVWLLVAWVLGVTAATAWFIHLQQQFQHGLGRMRKRADGLYEAGSVQGLPAAMGWLHPRIVVPYDFDTRYDAQEQLLLRTHEHQHIEHGDLRWNALAVLLRSLFWFNPLLHYAARHFRHDQELACDQRVITLHPKARRVYGEAMLKTQLAAQPLPLGCHWGFSHPLKERIAMLGQPSPSTRRRIIGRAAVVALALACGYTAWAAQPKNMPAAAVPAGRIQVKSVLRIDGGDPKTFTYTVAPGAQLTLSQAQNGKDWTIDAVVTKSEDVRKGMLMYAATIRRDGVVVGTPKIGVNSGVPGTIRIGEEGPSAAFEGIELVVTLTDGDANNVATANSSGIGAADGLPPPAYPAEALAKKQDGKVVLLVDMDATGTVTGVKVERSEPAGVFDAAAVEAAWKWRFKPEQETGKAVAGRVRVPVTFEGAKERAGSATPKA
ncbi:TonB family protein [Lysobacter tyrosinilyticus]